MDIDRSFILLLCVVVFQLFLTLKNLVIYYKFKSMRKEDLLDRNKALEILDTLKKTQKQVDNFMQEQESHYNDLNRRMQIYSSNLSFVQQELLKLVNKHEPK